MSGTLTRDKPALVNPTSQLEGLRCFGLWHEKDCTCVSVSRLRVVGAQRLCVAIDESVTPEEGTLFDPTLRKG